MSNDESSTVVVGAASDTVPQYTVTLTRDEADTVTDLTAATLVVLVLPDGSTKTVTKVSATVDTWIGTVQYQAWWTEAGAEKTYARVTLPDGQLTMPEDLVFSIKRA